MNDMRLFWVTLFWAISIVANATSKQKIKFYSEPNNYTGPARVLAESYGDLDGDGLPEKVVVLDSGMTGDSGLGSGRDLLIYKMNRHEIWHLWHTSRGPVLDSHTGGGADESFSSITINRGTIIIKHSGGSRGKWSYTNRYRYQDNDWYLIGLTVYQGVMCDEFMKFDYNLLTGQAIYEQGIEFDKKNCDDASIPKQKPLRKIISLPVQLLPKMDGFSLGSNRVKLTDSINREIYY